MDARCSRDFDPSALHGQFRLAPAHTPPIPGWLTRACGGWELAHHPSLPVSDLLGDDGQRVGWVVGASITMDGECSPAQIPLGPGGPPEAVHRLLENLGGRFVVVLLAQSCARVYLDGCGSLATVYAQSESMVASTPTLIGGEHPGWDAQLQALIDPPRTGLWYPLGFTPKRGVRRLLPNHYLDLATMSVHRHWPGPGDRVVSSDCPATVAALIGRIQHLFSSLSERFPLILTLTAGCDSRMLLACAKPFLGRAHFFTAGDGADADAHIAHRLARRFGLQHQQLPLRRSSPAQRADWDMLTGRCVAGEIANIYTSFASLDARGALLPGIAGEIGRPNYGLRVRDWQSPLTAPQLLRVMRMPEQAPLLGAMQDWLDGLAGCDNGTVFDLLYIEHRVGAWAGPQHYGSDGFVACHITPFTDRRAMNLALSLPWDYRYSDQLPVDLCAMGWPELLELPFNEFTGMKRHVVRVQNKFARLLRRLS